MKAAPKDTSIYYQWQPWAKTLPKASRRKCLGLSLLGQDCHHSGKPHDTALEAKPQNLKESPPQGPTTQIPRKAPGQRPPSRVTPWVAAHLEPQLWMSSFLKGNAKGGEEGAGLGRSPREEGNTKQSGKKIQPRPGVGSGHRHRKPNWAGTSEAPQGCTQLLHHSQTPCDPERALTHLLRHLSSLPSSSLDAPKMTVPDISGILSTSQDPVFPRCGELAPAQLRGEGLHFCLLLGEGF